MENPDNIVKLPCFMYFTKSLSLLGMCVIHPDKQMSFFSKFSQEVHTLSKRKKEKFEIIETPVRESSSPSEVSTSE